MTQDFVFFFLNGRPVRVQGESAFGSLAEYLRRECGLTGTKIACAQGACGACTVLVGRSAGDKLSYLPVNSCLQRVFQLHGAHVVTVEGLHPEGERDPELNPIQQAMWECHGAQCGFCTPGFVMSMTAWGENPDRPDAKTSLCGNLCRCTGYAAILEAASSVDWERHRRVEELYPSGALLEEIWALGTTEVVFGGHEVFAPGTLAEAVEWRSANPDARVISGGTEFGTMEAVSNRPSKWLSLGGVAELKAISVTGDSVIIGAGANWASVQDAVRGALPEFAELLDRWGSPQLRSAGTVGGSIVNASAVSDVLPLLLVCEAELEVHGPQGERRIPVEGKTELGSGEMLVRVRVPLPAAAGAKLRLKKISRRNGFDRAVVNAAFWWKPGEIRIAFGGAGDRVLRLTGTEKEFLGGASPERAAEVAQSEISPKTDGTAGAAYRRQLVTNLLTQWAREALGEVA